MADQLPLFGTGRKARTTKVLVSNGATQRLWGQFKAHHQREFGCDAALGTTFGHAMRILKELHEAFGEEIASAVIEAFFSSGDPKITSSGYTVRDLSYHAPRLRLKIVGQRRAVPDETLAHNLEVAKRLTKG